MARHHHHPDPAAGDLRVALAVAVNLALTVAQIVGGLFAGSLSLIADALHNLSDAMSLIIAFVARRIGRRPSDESMTFGYARVEIVAALINYTTLIIIGLFLVYEASMRFFEPQIVDGWLIVIIACIALAVDAITGLLTYTLSRQSINMRAAFLHNVADALGSVGVIVAGTLIIIYDWWIIDPIVTLGIAGYILWLSITEIGGVIRILMLGSPPDIDMNQLIDSITEVVGVNGVHHAHLWQMDEHRNAMDAHIVIDGGSWHRADDIKQHVRDVLLRDHSIAHVTLELECRRHACTDTQLIGYTSH
ncbi:MAG: cation transporter [Granulosicoccus sp.]|nr:cation transporter [Granulosicoccus sp.]